MAVVAGSNVQGVQVTSRQQMLRARRVNANRYGADFLQKHQGKVDQQRRQLAHKEYDRAMDARARAALARKTSPKQFEATSNPFKQYKGSLRTKKVLPSKVSKAQRNLAADRQANGDRVGKNNRNNKWTGNAFYYSQPQRTDPRTFRYEKSDYKDVRMSAPMYSSFTRNGVFREPTYDYKPKVKPRKLQAPRLSDYESSKKNAYTMEQEEATTAASSASEPKVEEEEGTSDKDKDKDTKDTKSAEKLSDDLRHKLKVSKARKIRPVSAPPTAGRSQVIGSLQASTMMDSLKTKQRPCSALPRSSSMIRPASAVRTSGFQNIIRQPMVVIESDQEDEEDFAAPVLSPTDRKSVV